MTDDPAFFGYGSLVNIATHDYTTPVPATLTGWRRIWQTTTRRDTAFLSVTRDASAQIDGLIARVPDADWAALDRREAAYFRIDVTQTLSTLQQTMIYKVQPDVLDPKDEGGILLSYLDVVVQGYLNVFGAEGVARFFATTDSWERQIIDDRNTPRYPRHQPLSEAERALVDKHLNALP